VVVVVVVVVVVLAFEFGSFSTNRVVLGDALL